MNGDNNGDERNSHRVTVEATDIDGIVSALDLELAEPAAEAEEQEIPDELDGVLRTIHDIYAGVQEATEQDSRGRSRKMVREYAGREDLDSNEVGHLLRVLESHDLVVQDGNRWRVTEADED